MAVGITSRVANMCLCNAVLNLAFRYASLPKYCTVVAIVLAITCESLCLSDKRQINSEESFTQRYSTRNKSVTFEKFERNRQYFHLHYEKTVHNNFTVASKFAEIDKSYAGGIHDMQSKRLRFARSAVKTRKRRIKSRIKNRQKSEDFQISLVEKKDYLSEESLSPSSPSPMRCPALLEDRRVIVNCTDGRNLNSRCTVNCAPGYRFPAGTPATTRCRISRKLPRRENSELLQPSWSERNDDFVCELACTRLIAPPNGKISCDPGDEDRSNTIKLHSCTVTCDPGYTPSHTMARYCRNDATWSGTEVTCQANPSKQKRPLFIPFQRVECGNVYQLTTFSHLETTYLIAGDTAGNVIRIYKWVGDRFSTKPWQVIHFENPLIVEVIPDQYRRKWLVSGDEKSTSFFRFKKGSRFVFSHLTRDFYLTKRSKNQMNKSEGFSLFYSNHNYYRCKGQRNKSGRSVVVVQKLFDRAHKRDVFRRVMRRKLRAREYVYQCSMFVANGNFHTAISTVNSNSGQGRILFGVPHNGRMKITEWLKNPDFLHLSDIKPFRSSDKLTYLVVGQRTTNGSCFVYQSNWNDTGGG